MQLVYGSSHRRSLRNTFNCGSIRAFAPRNVAFSALASADI